MSAVIGVDPGVQGGIAVLGANGAALYVRGLSRGMSEREVVAIIAEAADILFLAGGGPAFVETVHHQTGDGGKGSFTFGGIYRAVRAVLLTKGVPLMGVYPAVWQGRLNCLTGGDKNVSKRRAKELFPNVKVLYARGGKITHATADALLIAEYGRRMTDLRPMDPLA